MSTPAPAITPAALPREEQLAEIVEAIVKADYRRDGKQLVQAGGQSLADAVGWFVLLGVPALIHYCT